MREKIIHWINTQHLIMPGDAILAACSGGADSLTLVHLLDQLRSLYGYTLAVAHVNHMLRGSESAADAKFVKDFCQQKGLAYYETEVDVIGFIRESGCSPEEGARILRYRYLREIAAQIGKAKIATGHHRDDQAETVLLNLLRGAGSKGLSGMPTDNDGDIIRPLLAVKRSDIEEYCRLHQLQPRIDSTNLSTDYLRNKVRLELLPMLARDYNPAIRDTLWRTAAILSAQDDFVQKSAAEVLAEQAEFTDNCLRIRIQGLLNLHLALQREVLRLAVKKKQGHIRGISFYHVEKLIELVCTGTVGKVLILPGGLIVQRTYDAIELGFPTAKSDKIPHHPVREILKLGKNEIGQLGIVVTVERVAGLQQLKSPNVAVFDAIALYPPLHIRTRRPGDHFYPLGAPGSKKLKDFFIDQKVPLAARDSIPLLCDCQGILWVGGYRQGERGKVTADTRSFLQLTIIKQGETIRG